MTFTAHQPFHADLLEGIYLAAEPAGYDVALSALTPSRHERRAVESLLDYRCEALILLGPQSVHLAGNGSPAARGLAAPTRPPARRDMSSAWRRTGDLVTAGPIRRASQCQIARRKSRLARTSSIGPSPAGGSSCRMVSCSMTYQPA
jgi:hypothetical protein